jgi:glycosyltransferase involved in cell wall biosynthesis
MGEWCASDSAALPQGGRLILSAVVKISIAVPSRNYGQFLGACLRSIQTQDYDEFEVLIADNASSDRSLDIINAFVAQDSRFRLVSTRDCGQADGVNRALREATGDIACFLNADDMYLERDVLRKVARVFSERPDVDVVTFGGCYLDAEGNRTKAIRHRYHPLDHFGLMKRRTAVLQPSTFWRCAISKRIPFRSDLHFAFDAVFFYQLFVQYRWLELPDRVAGCRLHGANKSLDIAGVRVRELAELEGCKFGPRSFRRAYLLAISRTLDAADRLTPVVARPLKRLTYVVINSLSYLTVYRLPSI